MTGLTAVLIGWPGFEDGRVYWSRGCFGDPGGCAGGVSQLRRGTYTSPISYQQAPGARFVLAHERDSGVTWELEQPHPAPAHSGVPARSRDCREPASSNRCSRGTRTPAVSGSRTRPTAPAHILGHSEGQDRLRSRTRTSSDSAGHRGGAPERSPESAPNRRPLPYHGGRALAAVYGWSRICP